MNLLIDTHIFLWAFREANHLNTNTRTTIFDPKNALHLSIISIWEIQIKVGIGKLQLSTNLHDFVTLHCGHNDIRILPITEQHVWTLGTLPHHHRDPFDRMLIAQAIHDNLTLVSADKIFTQYPVTLLDQASQA